MKPSKQCKKLIKYLKGMSEALSVLADEISEAKEFDRESEDLLSKIGSGLLFTAKSYTFLE